MVSRIDLEKKNSIYSWAVKIDFTVNSGGRIDDLVGSSASLLWLKDYILKIETRKIHPQLADSGATGYRLEAKAMQTACEAEALGVRLAYSLLSVAIEKNWGLSLSWPDSPLPCRVIDRTVSKGASSQAFLSVLKHIKTSEFVSGIEESFNHHEKVPYSLLLSMELCASSHFENNERSKLIMLVSAFEALAKQNDLSETVNPLIKDLKNKVKEFGLEDITIRDSLMGQIENLKRESVRRALKRLLANAGLDEDDRIFVDEAYQARSEIVHEGKRVPELHLFTGRLNRLLKQVYSSEIFREDRKQM